MLMLKYDIWVERHKLIQVWGQKVLLCLPSHFLWYTFNTGSLNSLFSVYLSIDFFFLLNKGSPATHIWIEIKTYGSQISSTIVVKDYALFFIDLNASWQDCNFKGGKNIILDFVVL